MAWIGVEDCRCLCIVSHRICVASIPLKNKHWKRAHREADITVFAEEDVGANESNRNPTVRLVLPRSELEARVRLVDCTGNDQQTVRASVIVVARDVAGWTPVWHTSDSILSPCASCKERGDVAHNEGAVLP